MAGLLSFNSKELITYLDAHDLHQTWINLLATHIQPLKKFSYILESDEFKGFEILPKDMLKDLTIGEVGVLYEFSVSHLDSTSRKDKGQYFTPDDVAQFMVSKISHFPKGKWLDPCSGVGNLSWHLINVQEDKEDFLVNNLILTDLDELSLLIARTLFTVNFQDKRKNLFNEIKQNFQVFDFLSVADSTGQLTTDKTDLQQIPAHDYVIVNPPYLAISPARTEFETAKSRDLYAYFLENIIKTSKGFISITPQSFTNAEKFTQLRKLLLRKYENLVIYNFDNVPANVFHGIKFGSKNSNTANSIRPSVIIAHDGPGKRRITSLIRWRSSERKTMFDSVDQFLSETELFDEYFPKVNKVFEALFKQCSRLKTVDSLIASKKTDHILYVPSTPRYFIPALKTSVSRQSIKTLYFNNEKDLNRAYLLINSTFAYWWWRVRDGGMTLSMETIKSIPLLDFPLDDNLVKELEESEKANKVFKKNAGVEQENVKHPKELVIKINELVAPAYAEKLIVTAENSELEQLKFLK